MLKAAGKFEEDTTLPMFPASTSVASGDALAGAKLRKPPPPKVDRPGSAKAKPYEPLEAKAQALSESLQGQRTPKK